MIELEGKVSWQYGKSEPTSPDAALVESIRMLKGRITDWTDIFYHMAAMLGKETQLQFSTEGSHFHTKWAGLAKSTIERRLRDQGAGTFGPSHPILERTAALKDSFIVGDTNNWMETTPDMMEWGSRLGYSIVHETGGGDGFAGDAIDDVLNNLTNILSTVGWSKATDILKGASNKWSMPARPILVMTDTLKRKVKKAFTKAIWEAGQKAHFKTAIEEDGGGAAGAADILASALSASEDADPADIGEDIINKEEY